MKQKLITDIIQGMVPYLMRVLQKVIKVQLKFLLRLTMGQ